MSQESQLQMFQKFTQKQEQKSKIQIGGQVQAIFDYCEYIIHVECDKKSKNKYKFKQRKKQVSQDFMRAFSTLDRQDKINYYIKNVIYLQRINNGNFKAPQMRKNVMQATVYTLSYTIKRWKEKKMRLDLNRQIIFTEKNNTIKQYDLGDYIFRGSKNNNKYYAFVLQAIKQTVYYKSKTVHIGFKSAEQRKQWADSVQLCIDYRHWQRIYLQMYKKQPPRETEPILDSFIAKQNVRIQTTPNLKVSSKLITKDEQKLQANNKQSQSQQQFYSDNGQQNHSKQQIQEIQKTIIQDLVEGQTIQAENMQNIQVKNMKNINNKSLRNLDIFHKMFPLFQLNQIQSQFKYELIHSDNNIRIMQNSQQKQKYKLVIEYKTEQANADECAFRALCCPDWIKLYNENVQQYDVKTLISSQNSAIMYMAIKQFNRIYRPRDFLFVRHCFRVGQNAIYIADKGIENSNYPPFITVVRGIYECVWAVLKKPQNIIKLIANVTIDNAGYLTDNQNTNLSLNYFKNFGKIKTFIQANKQKIKSFTMFDFDWDITKNKQNKKQEELRIKKKSQLKKLIKQNTIKNGYQTSMNNPIKLTQELNKEKKNEAVNIKISKQQQLNNQRKKMLLEEVDAQIDKKELQSNMLETNQNVNLNFDNKGMIILGQGYIKNKYNLAPTSTYPELHWISSSNSNKHTLFDDRDWKHDMKNGGLLFINQKKMDDQKNVIKFILSKIGKNLLSGKSILSISLPVDIFVAKSNLQLFIQSLCYGPVLLQKAVKMTPFQKFKIVAAFGISMSPLYLIMQKPFNPILGETFQAWIHGCPAYAEQISHHPPICSLLLYGRGYTISGQFQSKAQIHMNSGTGTNDGIFRINFDDGTKFCFCSGGGQVSGLTYGDRKFNILGKAYCWSQNELLFSQIAFNPSKKGFFSMKKQQQPQDYFEGEVVTATSQFIKSLQEKRRAPNQKQIAKPWGKFNGIWHKQLKYQNQLLLNYNQQLPYRLQYQKHPLPSDSNWREDIAYRRLMQIPRAQIQKQRLQNFQRNDRKLREKKKN